jgi:hypothetical protein
LPISEVSELVMPAIGTRRSLLASGVADETRRRGQRRSRNGTVSSTAPTSFVAVALKT